MAFVDDAVQTHPGNGGNDAELAPGVFEHRVLLDMDFKESFNVRGIDLFSGQGIRVEPERTQCIVGGPLGVAQAFQALHVDLPRNALTAEACGTEIRPLFLREGDEFDGAFRLVSFIMEGTQRLQRGDHAVCPVIASAVTHGVEVGTGEHGGSAGRAFNPGVQVPHAVGPRFQPDSLQFALKHAAGTAVRLRP